MASQNSFMTMRKAIVVLCLIFNISGSLYAHNLMVLDGYLENQQSKQSVLRSGDQPINTKQILQQSEQLFAEQKYYEAIALLEKYKPQFDKNHPDYSYLLISLGSLYAGTGNYQKGEAYYLEAKAIRGKTLGKEHPDYLMVIGHMGTAYEAQGNYPKAEACYLELKTTFEKTLGKEHQNYAIALNNLGNLYQNIGDFRKAEIYLLEAVPIFGKTFGKDHPYYGTILNNLGLLSQTLGNYQEAVKYYLEAIPILEKTTGMQRAMYAMLLSELGGVLQKVKSYPEAEAYYVEALSIFEKALGKEQPQYVIILKNLGGLYLEAGNFQKAGVYLTEAKTVWEKLYGKEHRDYAIILNDLGALYFYMGNFPDAEKTYAEAKSIWEKTMGREHFTYLALLNNIFFSYLNTKKYSKAETLKDEADRALILQVNKNFAFLSDLQRSMLWDQNKYNFEASYSLTHLYPTNTTIARSYNNTLFTKGLLLRTTNGVRDAIYSSGDKTIINKYEQLGDIRSQIDFLQKKESPDIRMIGALEIRADSLDKILTIASGAYNEAKADMSSNWLNIRATLQPGETAVEFVHFRCYNQGWKDSTFYCAMVLKKDSKAPVWIPLCEERQLQALAKRTDDVQEDTKALYSGTNGTELYRLIWQPLEKELKDVRTVYYSPSGMLHQIAFAALPVNNSMLSDKYDLQLVSSTREIVRLKKEKPGILPQGTAAVYGGLWYDADRDQLIAEAKKSNLTLPQKEIGAEFAVAVLPKDRTRGQAWDYLAGTETEAKYICDYLKGRNIPNRLYTETAGNEESFKRLSGTSAGIIHLATHGFFLEDANDDNNREVIRTLGGHQKVFENALLRSGLLMAGANRAWTREGIIEDIEDGILTADEIARMNLAKTRLVVLSACETGLGVVKSAEGVFGLQRAFKLAGVETLVMSLWTVPDEATSELMSAFYKLWLSGKTKRDAFAMAQRQVREKYKEPFYWAGFVMMD